MTTPADGPHGADPRAEAMRAVAASLDKVGDRLRRRSDWTLAVLAVLLVVVLVQAYNGVQDGKRREASRELLQKTSDTSERIKSCTDPNGECYKRGQERTSQAVAGIVLGDVRVSECVVAAEGDVSAFRKCVATKGLPVSP